MHAVKIIKMSPSVLMMPMDHTPKMPKCCLGRLLVLRLKCSACVIFASCVITLCYMGTNSRPSTLFVFVFHAFSKVTGAYDNCYGHITVHVVCENRVDRFWPSLG